MGDFETDMNVVIRKFMASDFRLQPYDWQVQIIRHFSIMAKSKSPASVFCVRSTGGGKSAVRDTIRQMLCGVTLTICPLLSLAAQQTELIEHRVKDHPHNTGCAAYHIDEIIANDNDNASKCLFDFLRSMNGDTENTVFLFSSPQAITSEKSKFRPVLYELIAKKVLRLICIDEVHLFARFGLHFRDEFPALKECLFEKVS
jgi:superfamily II DNA helicase RecQ